MNRYRNTANLYKFCWFFSQRTQNRLLLNKTEMSVVSKWQKKTNEKVSLTHGNFETSHLNAFIVLIYFLK